MFGLSKPVAYGMIAAVALSAAAAIWFTLRADLKQAGGQDVIVEIGKENDDASVAAEKRRAALRDCNSRGGLFDYAAGTCQSLRP